MDEATQQLRCHGWCQGRVLPEQLEGVPDLVDLGDGERLLVVSQDCDVVHRSLDVEPEVELLAFEPLPAEKAKPTLLFGRNPRSLHIVVGSPQICLQFDVRRRFVIPRQLLASEGPDSKLVLEASDIRLVSSWLAKRYTRAAFPDAFNERVAAADKKIENQLKKQHAGHITGLFLMLEPRVECVEGQNYRVVLRLTAQQSSLEDEVIEAKLAEAVNKIGEALGKCDGVDVLECQLISEDDFSLADLSFFQRWDRDYRSHSGKPGGAIAPSP